MVKVHLDDTVCPYLDPVTVRPLAPYVNKERSHQPLAIIRLKRRDHELESAWKTISRPKSSMVVGQEMCVLSLEIARPSCSVRMLNLIAPQGERVFSIMRMVLGNY